jgi:hypothetical protein
MTSEVTVNRRSVGTVTCDHKCEVKYGCYVRSRSDLPAQRPFIALLDSCRIVSENSHSHSRQDMDALGPSASVCVSDRRYAKCGM